MEEYLQEINNRAYQEIVPIIVDIRNNLSCPYCGSKNYYESECMYCFQNNNALESLINKLNRIIERYSDSIANIDIMDMPENDFFNFISSFREVEIDKINDLLDKYNYREKYKILKNRTYNKISVFDTELLASEISIIQNEIFNDKTDLDIGKAYTFFVRNSFTKGQNISYDSFCELLKKYVIMEAKSIGVKGKCEIVKNNKEKEHEHDEQIVGSQFYEKITISDEVIKKLYEGKNYSAIIAIYHELTHLLQFKENKSIELIEEIKDKILSTSDPNYYNDNYEKVSFELEARYYGLKLAIRLLEEKIGIKVNREGFVEEELKYLEAHLNDKTRIYNGEEVDLDVLFTEYIKDKPELLKKYPQLNLLYKIHDDNVYLKSSEELSKDYEDIMNNSNINEKEKRLYEIIFSKYIETYSKNKT